MTSRVRTAAVPSRVDDIRAWRPVDSDSDRPRQTMATTQRHNIGQRTSDAHKSHRTSSRRADAQEIPPTSVPLSSHVKSSSRDRAAVIPPSSSYYATHMQNQASAGGTPGATHSSHSRTQETSGDAYNLRTYIKRRTDKHSPRSSNEKVPSGEEGRTSRSNLQSRAAYATTTAASLQASSSSQIHLQPFPTTRDPSSSARVHTDREKDREKEKSRIKAERAREKDRVRAADTEKDREAEKEKDRERRRARERDKDRSGRERDKQKDKEKAKDRNGRRRDESRPSTSVPLQSSVPSHVQGQQYADNKTSATIGRHGGQPVHASTGFPADPSTSFGTPNIVQWGFTGQQSTNVRPSGIVDSRRDEPAGTPRVVPSHVPARDKVSSRTRPHRDKTQQSGQESGMSSSEQEQSGRERQRPVDRRYATREHHGDGHPSGPSGSETERTVTRERRKASRTHDEPSSQARAGAMHESGHKPQAAQTIIPQSAGTINPEVGSAWNPQTKSKDSSGNRTTPHVRESPTQRPLGVAQLQSTTQTHASAALAGQPTALVGQTTQRFVPQIVSIRAGQGPADPQTPSTLPRSFNTALGRMQDASFTEQNSSREASARPQASNPSHQPPHATTTQSYNAAVPSHFNVNSSDGPSRTYSAPPPGFVPTGSYHNNVGVQSHGNNAYGQAAEPAVSHYAMQTGETIVRPPSAVPPTAIRVPTQDMPSRFPVNEDAPVTASSSQVPPVSATKPYFPDSKIPIQPQVLSVQSAMPGYPAYVSVQIHDTRDPRSSKAPNMQPSLTTNPPTTSQASRAQHTQHSKEPLAYPISAMANGTAGGNHSPGRHGQPNYTPSPATKASAPLAHNSSSYSPSRDTQHAALRSPGTNNVMPPASATPKHSPSGRLHSHRNGSDDTITQPFGSKSSPLNNASQQSLPHRTSATNLQSHAPSRPDTTSSARPSNALSGYPEPARYRSPPPSTYPHPQAASTSYVSQAAVLPSHSPSYSTQTPTSTSRPTLVPTSTVLPPEYYARSPDADISYSAQTPMSSQRVPPRSAPSPAPTINARQYYGSSPSSRPPVPLPSSSPQPLRTSTYPVPAGRRPPTAPVTNTSHSRTASEPQYAAYASRPSTAPSTAASKYNTAPRNGPSLAVPAPEADGMTTPSSLAPSMSSRQPSMPGVPMTGSSGGHSTKDKDNGQKGKDKEPRRRGGLFSLFRSRSTPPKPLERGPPITSKPEPRQRQVSQPTVPSTPTARPMPNLAATVSNPAPPSTQAAAPAPAAAAAAAAVTPAPPAAPVSTRIAAPVPVPGRRSPGSKMFTPFRLLSKRHRTVSSASVDAVDGTVANTVITGADSTRSSTAGRPSPPLRDPVIAAQEWRNREEAELAGRGTYRRRRPGVVFDVEENAGETQRPPQRISARRQQAQAHEE